MKKTFLSIIFLFSLFASLPSNAYFYSEYYNESVNAFINSPNLDEINNIENKIVRHCEQVYLEATRRREYTELELKYCSDIFQIKRQQEMDYMTYMFRNRGIY
ncbi:MAG: hypothetical protein QM490_01230 [Candidatus Gracilibacteria bacterium]